jgi:hypothetical protein
VTPIEQARCHEPPNARRRLASPNNACRSRPRDQERVHATRVSMPTTCTDADELYQPSGTTRINGARVASPMRTRGESAPGMPCAQGTRHAPQSAALTIDPARTLARPLHQGTDP